MILSIDPLSLVISGGGCGGGGILCAVQSPQVLRSELLKERMREIEVMRHSGREERHHLSKATIDRVSLGFDNTFYLEELVLL